jgi:hypothetical protein
LKHQEEIPTWQASFERIESLKIRLSRYTLRRYHRRRRLQYHYFTQNKESSTNMHNKNYHQEQHQPGRGRKEHRDTSEDIPKTDKSRKNK